MGADMSNAGRRMPYRLTLALLLVTQFGTGCATTPRSQQGQFAITPYKSPERIHAALGVTPQQLSERGELWETYTVGNEQITVHYQFTKRP